MSYLKKNLGIDNCIKFKIGDNIIMLDEFQKFYNSGFGSESIVIKNRKGYFIYGWKGNNKIVKELEKDEIKVYNLENYIKEKIYEKILEGLFDYVEENKNKQLFNRDSIYLWKSYSKLGKNPLNEIQDNIDFRIGLEDLENNEILLGFGGKSVKYNLVSDEFYINDTDIITEKESAKIVMNAFTTNYNRNLYVLYHNYINNNLKGEDLAYKEIADLNKWFEDKQNVKVVYDDFGVEKEAQVKANTDNMFSDLSREYYKEMLSFWGVDNIRSITQIKGFKFRNDFYKFNTENLLYKEVK